tara:strand:+ start:551 stop:784 length:234 start_codon:yes stop_codon:yes gene_type:complete
MKSSIEKQILEFQEELSKQIKTRDHAKKVFDECTNNINALQGGIQFGEILLKKNESSDQQLNTVEPNPQSKTAPSQK